MFYSFSQKFSLRCPFFPKNFPAALILPKIFACGTHFAQNFYLRRSFCLKIFACGAHFAQNSRPRRLFCPKFLPAALILLKIFARRARIFKNVTFASHGPKTLRRLWTGPLNGKDVYEHKIKHKNSDISVGSDLRGGNLVNGYFLNREANNFLGGFIEFCTIL